MVRPFERYNRAFEVLCGDNLHMNPVLLKFIRSDNKHVITALKTEELRVQGVTGTLSAKGRK